MDASVIAPAPCSSDPCECNVKFHTQCDERILGSHAHPAARDVGYVGKQNLIPHLIIICRHLVRSIIVSDPKLVPNYRPLPKQQSVDRASPGQSCL